METHHSPDGASGSAENPGNWRDRLKQDVHWGFRGLRRSPGSAAAIVVLLALGMGGVTALFGPLYSLVLKPLPFPDSGQLVQVSGDVSVVNLSARWSELDRVFSGVAAYSLVYPQVLSDAGPTTQVDVSSVTAGFFSTLGASARLGSSGGPGVVVSDRLWRERLRSTQDLRTCSITLNGRRVPVVGVMPPGFDFPSGAQIWRVDAESGMYLVARLRSGVSITQAQSYLRTLVSKRALERGGPQVESLHDAILGNRKSLIWILNAVSALFLVLACAGAANLLLARGARRRQEIVLRTFLGASRTRLVCQFLMESLILSAVGAALGLAISAVVNRQLRLALPAVLKDGASLSPGIVVFAILLTLAVAILCGLAPAFHATGGDLNSSLKGGDSIGASGRGRRILTAHEWFAAGQLIVAMALMGSTGLLVHSLLAKLNFPLGFQTNDLALVKIALPGLARAQGPGPGEQGRDADAKREILRAELTAEAARNDAYYGEAEQALTRLPGVASVALINEPPFSNSRHSSVLLEPRPSGAGARPFWEVQLCDVSVTAFRVLGLPLLAGRYLEPGDAPPPDTWSRLAFERGYQGLPGAVVVSETAAKRLWPGQNAIGQLVRDGTDAQPRRVVGVVADIREDTETQIVTPKIYKLFMPRHFVSRNFSFVVRLRPGASIGDFRAAARRALPQLPSDAAPPEIGALRESRGDLPLVLALLGCFSVLAIVVAGLGVYATGMLMAAARTRELGIRLAVGATGQQVGGLVLWRSIRLVLIALPIGAYGTWLLGTQLRHWLFQVGADDPATYLTSAATLLVIVLTAGLWPAVQASRTDPLKALRCDG